MSSAPILVLYNAPTLPDDHPEALAEHDIVEMAYRVSEILHKAGYSVARLGLVEDPQLLIDTIRRLQPAAVFNLFEGHPDDAQTEAYAAGILHWLGIPFTGSPFHALATARLKHVAKQLLKGAGLPTPDFFVVNELPVPENTLGWPVMVKPATQDASLGIEQESVASNQEQMENRIRYLLEQYGPPVMVEEFIPGREFNVALVENPELCYLPPSEIQFIPGDKKELWPILTYSGKWNPGTPDYDISPPRFPADISPELAAKMGETCMKAFRVLGCRDYARVDVRVRAPDEPFILEMNPNPEISANAGFAGCLATAGLTHSEFILQVLRNALGRREVHHRALDRSPTAWMSAKAVGLQSPGLAVAQETGAEPKFPPH